MLHTDPACGIGVLAPAVAQGAIPLAVHPAIAFSGTSMDLRALRERLRGRHRPGPVLPIAQALAVELGCEPVVVSDEAARPAYAEAIATAHDLLALHRPPGGGAAAPRRASRPRAAILSALVHTTVDHALAEADPGPVDSANPATIDG